MIRSSFKSENLVIMQVLTASSFWPETYNLSVHCTLYRDTTHHMLCHETQNTFSLLLCFHVFIRIHKDFSMVEKRLNKSFQTSCTFLRAPNIRPQMMSFTLNLNPEISTLAPLI